ncbi:MAG: xanthine dehydrogenase family protein subunit M [Thermodesulfobacteriota bacterium]
MGLPRFNYLAPKTIKEASALLAEHGDKARLMAGGTDLLIRLRHRAMTPEYVISLRGVPGLDHVFFDRSAGLNIGALAKLADVAGHPEIRKHYPALAESASATATVQIRNMGTLAGNICNAAPSADNATPLLVYEAEVTIVHPGGERVVPMDEFFRGPGLTALEKGEIVKEIIMPPPGPRTGSNYRKISARSRVDIAAVGVAALMQLDEEGVVSKVRIGLGAVAPVPLLAHRAARILAGRKPSPELIEQAGDLAADEARPINDVRATAAYRRRMVRVLTIRALQASLDLAVSKMTGCES